MKAEEEIFPKGPSRDRTGQVAVGGRNHRMSTWIVRVPLPAQGVFLEDTE